MAHVRARACSIHHTAAARCRSLPLAHVSAGSPLDLARPKRFVRTRPSAMGGCRTRSRTGCEFGLRLRHDVPFPAHNPLFAGLRWKEGRRAFEHAVLSAASAHSHGSAVTRALWAPVRKTGLVQGISVIVREGGCGCGTCPRVSRRSTAMPSLRSMTAARSQGPPLQTQL